MLSLPGGNKRRKPRKTCEPEILPADYANDSTKTMITLKSYLIKRRKWPYRGWHKRFFQLENGVLTYGKSEQDLHRGRYNGRCNLYSSCISYNSSSQRIHIDENNSVYHIKIKEKKSFDLWLEQIALHRRYHRNQTSGPTKKPEEQNNIYEQIPSNDWETNNEKKIAEQPIDDELDLIQEQLASLSTILDRLKQNISSSNVSSNVSTKSETTKTSGSHTPSASLSSNNSFYVGDYQKQDFIDIAKKILEKMTTLYQRLTEMSKERDEQKRGLQNLSRGENDGIYYSISSNETMSRHDSIFYDATENFEHDIDDEYEEADKMPASDSSSCGEYDQQDDASSRQSSAQQQLKLPQIKWRRGSLPATAPDTSGIGLWNIMRKAIGKDLSRVAMPVILNEPLGLLQKLCEEMEYSDLLDRASQTDDQYLRLVYVTAFIVSTYSSNYYRTGRKNFNPLLGETFECVREDKQWKFVAEQVSHHPPISVCSCESPNFIFTQKLQAKVKFWGKSMEIFPDSLNVIVFPKYRETITWNKCIMCIHNVLSSDRWIDHYGDVLVESSLGSKARISFLQSDYRTRLNNVAGYIIDQTERVVHKIFGHWHQDIFCGNDQTARCIWRQSAVPENSKQYYGFTRFAIELNELDDDLRQQLPPTDTRFRPDQRLLEAGKVDDAEREKARIEHAQRTRSAVSSIPNWFKEEENRYVLIGDENPGHSYWKKREENWKGVDFIQLW